MNEGNLINRDENAAPKNTVLIVSGRNVMAISCHGVSGPHFLARNFAMAKMVGETGFEPATPCTQNRCATRLRHSPTVRATWASIAASAAEAAVVGPAGLEPAT